MKFSSSFVRSPKELIQKRLTIAAVLFLFIASLTLTLAPAVRFHSIQAELRWQQWIGFAVWLAGFLIVTWQADRVIPDRDPYLLPIIGLMAGWGLITLFRLDPTYGFKQTIWLGICLLGVTVGLRIPNLLIILRRYKYIWLSLALALTLLTFFFGTSPSGVGPNLWLGLGGIYLQPSEVLKVILVVYLAAYLADSIPAKFRLVQLLLPTLLVAGAALMILIVQRDLGTASLFIALYTVIVYLASGKRRFLLISFLVIIAALVSGYFIFDVIQLRVEAWLNPWLDPNGRSYQIVQSIIAIADGGLFGRGIGLGSPGVVPVSQSDFIYPSIVEETGLMGAIAVVLLYAVLTLRGFNISLHAPNQFQRFLAAGVTTYFVSQALLIMGGTIRLLPLTGVTLPFFSYGGSSLVVAFFAALLLLIISNHTEEQSTPILQSKAYFLTGSVFLTALMAVALVTSWWSVFRADDLIARNDNPRRFISDQYVQRGNILDRNNTILAETVGEPGSLKRLLNYPSLSAIVGYTNANYGQGGLEASLDSYLRGVEGNAYLTILKARLLNAQYPEGADIRLSLDMKLQQTADDLMSGKTGGMVMLNAATGEILVMSTSPTFDANTLEENWETWKTSADSPLVNRVTQGQYPAGTSTGGLLLARLLSSRSLPPSPLLMKWSSDLTDPYFCTKNPGADPSWGSLIAAGCNNSFKMLDYYLGSDDILIFYQQLGLLDQPEISVAESYPEATQQTVDSTIDNPESDTLLVSPLQMAVAYSVLSNGGEFVKPQLATAYHYANSDWILFQKEKSASASTTLEIDQVGTLLSTNILPGWQMQSTAQTETGRVDWFIAGTHTNWKGTPIVLVVALEDSTSTIAESIGVEMFNTTVVSIK